MLRILCGGVLALDAFRAADNSVGAQLVRDLEKMVERTCLELDRFVPATASARSPRSGGAGGRHLERRAGHVRRPAAVRLIGQVGDVDCSIGLASDFPDEVLITVISSTGTWYQYAFQGGRSMPAPTGYKAGGTTRRPSAERLGRSSKPKATRARSTLRPA